MTSGGWIIMLVSVGSVAALFAWCIYKVLSTESDGDNLHGFEQEPPDVK